jgi:hypothetical protein
MVSYMFTDVLEEPSGSVFWLKYGGCRFLENIYQNTRRHIPEGSVVPEEKELFLKT